MKFIAVDRHTINFLVQSRRLQSTEFDEGAALASLICGEHEGDLRRNLPLPLLALQYNDGLYLLSAGVQHSRLLIFDLEAANPFKHLRSEDALLVLQKGARLAIKIWDHLSFSPSEHPVTGATGTKFVIFPFPLGSATQYRLTLDRVRRETHPGEDHLLAYRWGRDEGGGPDEIPGRSQFHRAVSGLNAAMAALGQQHSTAPGGNDDAVLAVTELERRDGGVVPIAMPFDNWVPLLTDVQRRFVLRELRGPERLEGPAGTGKTLALMLKSVHTLRVAKEHGVEHRSIFLTHSKATRLAIEERMEVIDPLDRFASQTRVSAPQSLHIMTLQEWCGQQLGSQISETEYLDRDALQSKELQLLYVLESLEEATERELPTHRAFMSQRFLDFLQHEETWRVAEMIQHEIAVVIKGRAEEDLEQYRKLPLIRYNLPLEANGDFGFVFVVFRGYQRRLEATNQFDTDDIVLTAMRQLDTPIWRRRREREGFDSIFIDESHLFNINELSMMHYLPKEIGAAPIAFAIDRAQAVGDRGLEDARLEQELLGNKQAQTLATKVSAVFRSSPSIVNLAGAITAGGATLFTNFDNPLSAAGSAFTEEQERLSQTPSYLLMVSDAQMVDRAYSEADQMARRLPGGRSAVAIVVFDNELMAHFKREARERNKPVEVVERRGDLEVVNRAQTTRRFVLASPEYIGGLEFDGVVIAGVDEGRVPHTGVRSTGEGQHFVRYAAHNLLYVAVTRAKYEVLVLANSERGLSEVLVPAEQAGLLVLRQA